MRRVLIKNLDIKMQFVVSLKETLDFLTVFRVK